MLLITVNLTIITLLTTFISALVIPRPSAPRSFPRASGDTVAAQLLQIAPASSTCNGAPFPSECATAEQAAPYFITAMQAYEIYSIHEIAAVLALLAFESGEFKYNINHFPGRPGQGTRAMFMPNFVLSYVRSIPALSPQLATIISSSPSENLTDGQLNAVRALVLQDEYSWASAAWFYTTQCASVRTMLQAGRTGQGGFKAYMSCVGVEATSERLVYWERANKAFGIA